MTRRTDYEPVAATFDRRYESGRYDSVGAFLDRTVAEAAGTRILELGCGTGHWLERFAHRGRPATGVDPSPAMLAKARVRPGVRRLVRGSAAALPFADGSFDVVVCVNALHHFDDAAASVRHAHRVLAPGGRFVTIGLDPHTGSDRWFLYEYFQEALAIDRQRYPSTSSIRVLLAEAGFEDARTEIAEHMRIDESARAALDDGRIARTSTSQLTVLTDDEYARGIRRIEADIDAAAARGAELRLSADLRLWGTVARRSPSPRRGRSLYTQPGTD